MQIAWNAQREIHRQRYNYARIFSNESFEQIASGPFSGRTKRDRVKTANEVPRVLSPFQSIRSLSPGG